MKHIPRKISDTNIIRCILLNINDHYSVSWAELRTSKERFKVMTKALVKNGIICPLRKDANTTSDYVISDVPKYIEWSKSDFRRAIEQYIIPLLSIKS